MRGSPFSPVAEALGRRPDWTPRLFPLKREESVHAVMVHYQAEYMVGGI
jgi:hypothetical protein